MASSRKEHSRGTSAAGTTLRSLIDKNGGGHKKRRRSSSSTLSGGSEPRRKRYLPTLHCICIMGAFSERSESLSPTAPERFFEENEDDAPAAYRMRKVSGSGSPSSSESRRHKVKRSSPQHNGKARSIKEGDRRSTGSIPISSLPSPKAQAISSDDDEPMETDQNTTSHLDASPRAPPNEDEGSSSSNSSGSSSSSSPEPEPQV